MKRKYFIIGFLSGFLFLVITLVIVFFVFKSQGEKSVKEFIENSDVSKVEMEAYPLTQESLDSLAFYELNSSVPYFITKDSNSYTFINYWATWCIPCVSELPEFKSLIEHNRQFDDIKFIFASQEKVEKIENFIKSKNIALPYYSYRKEELPLFIDHTTIPTSYFIDEENLIMYKFSGIRKWNNDFYQKLLSNLKQGDDFTIR